MKTNSGMNDKPEAAIFEAALACATSQDRAAYLDKACAGQHALRQRVEALLAAHDQATSFLENRQAASARPTIRLTLPPEEQVGERIGRYKLLQKIGEGGCGVVYMAEQEEPVRHRVALNVIKLGMDTKQVVARFEAERQALALMDHPNIAKIYDAGVTGRVVATDDGRARHSVRAGLESADDGAQGTDAPYGNLPRVPKRRGALLPAAVQNDPSLVRVSFRVFGVFRS